MSSPGMWHRVGLVKTDVSEKSVAHVPPKLQFLQNPHGATFQKTAFFILFEVTYKRYVKR
jgi:hypothetical protein